MNDRRRSRRPTKAQLLARVARLGPTFLGLILLDRYVLRAGNPFLGLPRTVPELFSPPDRVFRLLRRHGVVPPEARFVSCTHGGGADTEPGKNVARLDLTYNTPAGGRETMPLFVKLPTARRWSAVFKAALAAIWTDTKEIAFHNLVLPELARQAGGREHLGFAAPQNLFATWSRPFDRAILIQACVDMDRYHSRPDWMDADVAAVERIVAAAADLHRRTWQLQAMPANVLATFPEDGGVDWLDNGMELLLRRTPASFRSLWRAIAKRTAGEPVTISHGDCRLGNCLFSADFADVILTDWEANSITYYLWDVSYCMICSLSPEDRRRHERAILHRYLAALRQAPRRPDVPTLEQALELHRIGQLVINYFGEVIALFGGVGEKHGNTADDLRSWRRKLDAARTDALADKAALARTLDVDVALLHRFERDFNAYVATTPQP